MSWKQTLNKPTAKPTAPKPKFDTKDDDWDTDPTYENSVTEKSQRYGSESVPGSGRVDHVDFNSIQAKAKAVDGSVKEAYREKNPTRGYGGKYGTEKVMDKAAEDFSYKADIQKHSSQTDGKKGFGGEHGVDERAKDKSAVGFDYKATVEKHSSQTDSSKGFGGKFGTDQNVQDQSAVGFSHKEALPKHSSQTDYSAGFGGKYGVQKEEPKSTPTVVSPAPVAEPKTVEKSATPTSAKADVGNIRARFENMNKEKEAETTKRVAEERKKRTANEQYLQQSSTTEPVKKKEEQKAPSTVKETPTPSEVSKSDLSESKLPTPSSTTTDASVSNLSENNEETVQVSTSEGAAPNLSKDNENEVQVPPSTTEEESPRLVGGINVTSLLRQRKTSSSSSENADDEEDQWAADKD